MSGGQDLLKTFTLIADAGQDIISGIQAQLNGLEQHQRKLEQEQDKLEHDLIYFKGAAAGVQTLLNRIQSEHDKLVGPPEEEGTADSESVEAPEHSD